MTGINVTGSVCEPSAAAGSVKTCTQPRLEQGPNCCIFSIQLMNYLVLLHYALGTRTFTDEAGPLFRRPRETAVVQL
jgi:hypothetical protein